MESTEGPARPRRPAMRRRLRWWPMAFAALAGCGPIVVEAADGAPDAPDSAADGAPIDDAAPDAVIDGPEDAPGDVPRTDVVPDALPDALPDRPPPPDVPLDARPDAPGDSALDAAPDATPDRPPPLDRPGEGPLDAALDGALDARPDATLDAVTDRADAGPDAPDARADVAADVPLDRPDVRDVADVLDVADVRDVADVLDVADVRDVADVLDVADVRDVADVLDVADVRDVADVLDVADVRDAADALDVADVRDAADVLDATDALDVRDVIDVSDAADAADGDASTCSTAPHAAVAGSMVALDPPRPVAPLSTYRVTTATPRLRWTLAPGATGAVVEVCADRACAVVEQRATFTGSEATTPPLRPGTHFWRLFSRVGATSGTRPSPVWSFRVGARSASVASAWGFGSDFNGDGLGDAWVTLGTTLDRFVVTGATSLSVARVERVTCPDARGFASPAWDVDGDGFGDMILGASVRYGSAGGLRLSVTSPLTWTPAMGSSPTVGDPIGAGDIDGDGFGDVYSNGVVRLSVTGANDYVGLRWRGGLSGPATEPSRADGYGPSWVIYNASVAAGDLDGDGLADVAWGAGSAMEASTMSVRLASAATPALWRAGCFSPGFARPAGDTDGDGRSDVIAVVRCDAPGLSNGTYVCRADAATGNGRCDLLSTQIILPIALGDVNGDGYDDLFTVDGTLYRGSAAGPVAGPLALPGDDFHAPGDLNGDGYDDILCRVGTTSLRVYPGAASGLSAARFTDLPLP